MRQHEQTIIEGRLTKSQGSTLAFEGESGTGKTHIIQQAAQKAADHHIRAAVVACRGGDVFVPLQDLISGVLAVSDKTAIGKALKPLNLIEHTAALEAVFVAAPPPHPEPVVMRFTRGLMAVLEAIDQPLLLAFDDLDQAADEVQTLVQRLAQRTAHQRLVVLVTYGPDLPPAYLSTFGSDSFTLSSLTEEEMTALVETWQTSIPQAITKQIRALSEGNPLKARLIWEALAAKKDPDMVIPAPKEALRQQIGALPDEQQHMLHAAAVMDNGAPLNAVKAVAKSAPDETPPHLESYGTNRCRFTHRLIQQMILDDLTEKRRAELHGRAAKFLYRAAVNGAALTTHRALAHAKQAGDVEQAVAIIKLAIEAANREESSDTLVTLYQQAIELSDNAPPFAERLGDLHATAGRYEQASEVYMRYGGSIPMRAKLGLALLAVDSVRAVHVLSGLVARVPISHPDDLRWRVEAGLTLALAQAGRTYDAVRRGRDALNKLEDLPGFGDARTILRGMLGTVLFAGGEQIEAQPHLESARGGWDARADQQGVVLINQISNGTPLDDLTEAWLRKLLHPLLIDAA